MRVLARVNLPAVGRVAGIRPLLGVLGVFERRLRPDAFIRDDLALRRRGSWRMPDRRRDASLVNDHREANPEDHNRSRRKKLRGRYPETPAADRVRV